MIVLLIYVCLSAAGLTLLKIGATKECSLLLNTTGFDLKISWILILGFSIYVLSFLMSIAVMKNMNITLFYPLSAGLIYILVALTGFLILNEPFSYQQIFGMGIILAGIIVMNLGKGI